MAPRTKDSDDAIDKVYPSRPHIILRTLPPLVLSTPNNTVTFRFAMATSALKSPFSPPHARHSFGINDPVDDDRGSTNTNVQTDDGRPDFRQPDDIRDEFRRLDERVDFISTKFAEDLEIAGRTVTQHLDRIGKNDPAHIVNLEEKMKTLESKLTKTDGDMKSAFKWLNQESIKRQQEVDQRFAQMDQRFDKMEQRFNDLERLILQALPRNQDDPLPSIVHTRPSQSTSSLPVASGSSPTDVAAPESLALHPQSTIVSDNGSTGSGDSAKSNVVNIFRHISQLSAQGLRTARSKMSLKRKEKERD
ncbi:hypothetical protein C8Q76DRAFT_794940 [Earliella scabrosa]|nr:hypothetical protein C8Q76DRAFT_794940 [Earliella scabrosa]